MPMATEIDEISFKLIFSSNHTKKSIMKNNNVTLRGNVGTEVTLKALTDERKVANFNLATNEKYKDQSGEWQTKTQWHRVVVYGSQAEKISALIAKGNEVILEGKITSRNYTDKEGQQKTITEIVASGVIKTVREKATA